jgi:hypothetical protein
MTPLELYLIESGYTRYRSDGTIARDTDTYSTMGSLYFDYVLGDKSYRIGLHERDKPATLISPRPKVIREMSVNGRYFRYNNAELFDDTMNILLARYTPKELIQLIESGETITIFE